MITWDRKYTCNLLGFAGGQVLVTRHPWVLPPRVPGLPRVLPPCRVFLGVTPGVLQAQRTAVTTKPRYQKLLKEAN